MIQYFDFCAGRHLVAHLGWQQYLGLFILPNGVWLALPLYFILAYGKRLKSALDSMGSPQKNKKD